jgi:5-hydroxyisourate hydrolase
MTQISTHVLDTARGLPVSGLSVRLDRRHDDGAWQPVGDTVTDADGRVRGLADDAGPGTYRLVFATAPISPFFPEVTLTFRVSDEPHLHIPLLLSPYGYSTYRGS